MKLIDRISNINLSLPNDRKLKIIAASALCSFLCIIIIQRVIRPRHWHLTGFETFLQGTLPNFFASTGICSITFIYYNSFLKNGKNASLSKKIVFTSLFTFTGLTVWEIIQYFMCCPIDYDDIIMTALGCLTMSIIISIMYML